LLSSGNKFTDVSEEIRASLMTGAEGSSETFANLYDTTRHHIQNTVVIIIIIINNFCSLYSLVVIAKRDEITNGEIDLEQQCRRNFKKSDNLNLIQQSTLDFSGMHSRVVVIDGECVIWVHLDRVWCNGGL